ncbi:MAG: HAD-IC family P-type ATPase [Candidatus Pacebacteria bacterium]|nr:HAD-IC family P-type ATPase [Candidatus Paceibacterota bacterium]
MYQPHNEWWRISIPETLSLLETTQRGLTQQEVQERTLKHGYNELPEEKPETWLRLFIRQWNSPLLFILMVAAIIAIVLGEYVDGAVIFGVLVFNGVVGAFQEGKANQSLRALKVYTQTQTVVLRDGVPVKISSRELVPGDIIELYAGDRVPADARLFQADTLRVNESALTGESLATEKNVELIDKDNMVTSDQANLVFNGTFLVDGIAKAVVIRTGVNTVMGQISQKIANIETDIPLQKNINSLSQIIIIATVIVIVILGIVGLSTGYPWQEMLLMTSSLLVSVIPEGLPIVMTLVLALGVKRMAQKHALVKKLQAVEGLAHTTVVAVDKTGTITRNELMVQEIFVDNHNYTVTGQGYIPVGEILYEQKPAASSHEIGYDYAVYLSALSASASLMQKNNTYIVSGDPTEGALLVLGEKRGYTKSEILVQSPLLYEIPFNTKDKYYVNVHEIDGVTSMIVAGAPEIVLEKCSYIWSPEGRQELSQDKKEDLFIQTQHMAEKGLRVVMLAVKTHNVHKTAQENSVDELSCVALFGMQDSLRAEVPEAVAKTKGAGMRVVMITGDHKITAQAIATQAGIYTEGDEVLLGTDIDNLNDEELVMALDNVTVFARVTPDHKMRIVEAYKKRGDIIAMTGDGVNDVPPLAAAHLGLAMGTIGTEVTKESADMVLLDDNFATITAAIEEGRHIFNTLKKVFVYLFSTNFGELLLIALAIVLLLPTPLSPVQLLWINLISDTFLVLALAFEPMEKDILSQPFRKPTKYIIDTAGLVRIVIFGILIALGTFFVFLYYQSDLALARTMTLITLAFFEIFRLWSIRSEKKSVFSENPVRSPWLLGATLFVILLQFMIVHVPFMQNIFGTVVLSWQQWGISVGIGASILFIDEGYKFIARKIQKN